MKNKKLHQKKNLEKSPKYALRKLSVGVASWIIGWTYFSVGAEIIQPVSKEGSIEGGYEIKNSDAPIEGLGEELIFEDITDFPEGDDTNPRKDFFFPDINPDPEGIWRNEQYDPENGEIFIERGEAGDETFSAGLGIRIKEKNTDPNDPGPVTPEPRPQPENEKDEGKDNNLPESDESENVEKKEEHTLNVDEKDYSYKITNINQETYEGEEIKPIEITTGKGAIITNFEPTNNYISGLDFGISENQKLGLVQGTPVVKWTGEYGEKIEQLICSVQIKSTQKFNLPEFIIKIIKRPETPDSNTETPELPEKGEEVPEKSDNPIETPDKTPPTEKNDEDVLPKEEVPSDEGIADGNKEENDEQKGDKEENAGKEETGENDENSSEKDKEDEEKGEEGVQPEVNKEENSDNSKAPEKDKSSIYEVSTRCLDVVNKQKIDDIIIKTFGEGLVIQPNIETFPRGISHNNGVISGTPDLLDWGNDDPVIKTLHVSISNYNDGNEEHFYIQLRIHKEGTSLDKLQGFCPMPGN